MKYTTEQINTALHLVKEKGYTHEQASKKTKMGVHSINYYLVLNRKKKTKAKLLTKNAVTKTSTTLTNKYRAAIEDTITNLQRLL